MSLEAFVRIKNFPDREELYGGKSLVFCREAYEQARQDGVRAVHLDEFIGDEGYLWEKLEIDPDSPISEIDALLSRSGDFFQATKGVEAVRQYLAYFRSKPQEVYSGFAGDWNGERLAAELEEIETVLDLLSVEDGEFRIVFN